MIRHVVITGLMGVGKTTTATGVAEALSLQCRDSDGDIHRLLGRTGREVADGLGVDALHRLEAAVLLGALASPNRLVIAAAASTVEDAMCRAALGRTALSIVLEAPLDLIADRSSTGSHRRAIARADLEELAARRDPLFHEVADAMVSGTQPGSKVVADILAALTRMH